MSKTPTEVSPDQGHLIELSILIICDGCGKNMGESTAEWSQNAIDRKLSADPGWDRIVISHGTCNDCLAKAREEANQYLKS